jgi:hypothetical protein
MLAGGNRQFGALYGLVRFEAMEKDGQAVLAREHTNQLIVRSDRHNPWRHRQIQWRGLIVVMALVSGSSPNRLEQPNR